MNRAAIFSMVVVVLAVAGCDKLPFGGGDTPPPPPPVVAPPTPTPTTPVAPPTPLAPPTPSADKPLTAAPAPGTAGFEARRVAQRGTCLNTCRFANDGECDDGREDAHTDLCDHGSDCADCGPVGQRFRQGRTARATMMETSMETSMETTMDTTMETEMGEVAAMGGACTNTCQHANDNECDDGRPNAHTRICALGTDCADCGPVGQPFNR